MTSSHILRLIGYKYNPPYSNFKGKCWNIHCPNPGADVDFLKLTLNAAGFRYGLVTVSASSDESLRMINNGSADIGLNVARISLERMKLVQFSTPLNYMFYGYFASEIRELHLNANLIDVMEVSVYSLLLITLLSTSAIIYGMYEYGQSHIMKKKKKIIKEEIDEDVSIRIENRRLHKVIHDYKEWLFLLIAMIFKQAPRRHYSSGCSFFVLITSWIIFSMLFFVFYDSTLRSKMLTIVQKGYEFNTFDMLLDVLEKGQWKGALIPSGYSPNDFCSGYQCNRVDRLNNSFYLIDDDETLLRNEVSQPNTMTFGAIQMDMLKDSDVVIFDHKRNILFIKDTIMREHFLSIAVGKHLPRSYLERINRAMAQTMVSYAHLKARYQNAYPPFNSIQTSLTIPFNLSHYANLFTLLFILLSISFIILLCEILSVRFITLIQIRSERIRMDYRRKRRERDKRISYTSSPLCVL